MNAQNAIWDGHGSTRQGTPQGLRDMSADEQSQRSGGLSGAEIVRDDVSG